VSLVRCSILPSGFRARLTKLIGLAMVNYLHGLHRRVELAVVFVSLYLHEPDVSLDILDADGAGEEFLPVEPVDEIAGRDEWR